MWTQVHKTAVTAVLLAGAGVVTAQEPSPQRFQNLRTREANVQLALATCYERSATCHALIETVEASRTIAYLDTGSCRTSTPGSCVRFLADSGGFRYLRIRLDDSLHGDTVICMLAHELQHAVEILRAPDVTDNDALRTLYERIGYRSDLSRVRDEWETIDARRVADIVGAELKEARRALVQARR